MISTTNDDRGGRVSRGNSDRLAWMDRPTKAFARDGVVTAMRRRAMCDGMHSSSARARRYRSFVETLERRRRVGTPSVRREAKKRSSRLRATNHARIVVARTHRAG